MKQKETMRTEDENVTKGIEMRKGCNGQTNK